MSNYLIGNALKKEEDARGELAETVTALESQEQKAATALEQQLGLSYSRAIALGQSEWFANNPVRAHQLLSECLPRFRDWEWAYLDRLTHGERFSFDCKKRVLGVAVHPNSRLVAAVADGEPLRVWNLTTGKLEREIPLEFYPRCVAFSTNGDRIAVGGGPRGGPPPATAPARSRSWSWITRPANPFIS